MIDANALLQVVRMSYERMDSFVPDVPRRNMAKAALLSTIDLIGEAPTVDVVEVVHGEWIDKYEIKSFRHTNIPVVQCSKCECYFCDIINNHHFMYHYCPNCGAKMRGSE